MVKSYGQYHSNTTCTTSQMNGGESSQFVGEILIHSTMQHELSSLISILITVSWQHVDEPVR